MEKKNNFVIGVFEGSELIYSIVITEKMAEESKKEFLDSIVNDCKKMKEIITPSNHWKKILVNVLYNHEIYFNDLGMADESCHVSSLMQSLFHWQFGSETPLIMTTDNQSHIEFDWFLTSQRFSKSENSAKLIFDDGSFFYKL